MDKSAPRNRVGGGRARRGILEDSASAGAWQPPDSSAQAAPEDRKIRTKLRQSSQNIKARRYMFVASVGVTVRPLRGSAGPN
eukprot:7759412-Pyramimonas_sp.AAC.1